MDKMTNCKTCGAGIAARAKICPSCGAKNKRPVYQRVWFWLLIIFVVISVIGGIMGSDGDSNIPKTSSVAEASSNHTVTPKAGNEIIGSQRSSFTGDCGITASAEMGTSIIGYPELTIAITNMTDKEISAIQFYAVPCDVYGDEIKGWTTQNKLYTDTSIGVGESTSITYQFIEDSVKTVKLYVYSVYFSDGSEWGDKDATKSTILDHGALIEVFGES